MPFRFVHAADLHLDSPLRSLALADEELAAEVGDATRKALTRIVDLCLEERVDALLIAGDLYDGRQQSMKTAQFLARQIHRLDQAGVETFIIRGNHDAASKITHELVFPPSVIIFERKAQRVLRQKSSLALALHGISFEKPHAPQSLLPEFQPPVEGAVNIGLLHTSLGGAAGHDPYAPCSVAELQAMGFRYWALGHIHKRSVVAGETTIVMPGIPQGRDINEAGEKSVTLVTIADDGTIHLDARATASAVFERLNVDVSGLTDWANLPGIFEKAIEAAPAPAPGVRLIARLRLVGASPLAWRLRHDADLVLEQARLRASLAAWVAIEKIEIACRGLETKGATLDPTDELDRIIAAEVVTSPAFQDEARRLVEGIRNQLPREARERFAADSAAALDLRWQDLGEEGIKTVLAHLRAQAQRGDG